MSNPTTHCVSKRRLAEFIAEYQAWEYMFDIQGALSEIQAAWRYSDPHETHNMELSHEEWARISRIVREGFDTRNVPLKTTIVENFISEVEPLIAA